MFPRLQRIGLKPKHVEREAFKEELKHVDGHGDYWLLYQQSKPHLVAHVQLPKSEAEFDNILGWCLGQNKWCDYTEGNLSFICVIAGFNAVELTPKYPDKNLLAIADGGEKHKNIGKSVFLPKKLDNRNKYVTFAA